MDPDQTFPTGAVWSGSILCLTSRLLKHFSRCQNHMIFVVIGALRHFSRCQNHMIFVVIGALRVKFLWAVNVGLLREAVIHRFYCIIKIYKNSHFSIEKKASYPGLWKACTSYYFHMFLPTFTKEKTCDTYYFLLKVTRRQRSGIDTIKYHTWPRIPHGKVTKTQLNIINKSQEVSPFPAGDHKAAMNRRESMTNTRHK